MIHRVEAHRTRPGMNAYRARKIFAEAGDELIARVAALAACFRQ